MKRKIKILFYAHTIDYAGTWRSHERILLNLNRELFDPYVFYNPNQNNNRLEIFKNKFDGEKIIAFNASIEKNGPESGYSYKTSNFKELCIKHNFDIIHFARGGWYEWPFIERLAPIQIETNIFGSRDNSSFLDYSVPICDTVNNLRGGSDGVIYNPIPKPIPSRENLFKDYKISEKEYVFGRIGRPDNFDPISFAALKKLKAKIDNFKYIVIGACDRAQQCINDFNLNNNCILIPPTNNDELIHKFHNTIKIFLHYRSDGECHSTALSQAMMYGIPVLSHHAGINGQIETIKNGGHVANSHEEYYDYLLKMVFDKNYYDKISKLAQIRSDDFEEGKIIKKWEFFYIDCFKKLFK